MEWHDEFGRRVASGVYLYQLKAGKFVAVRKMPVLRGVRKQQPYGRSRLPHNSKLPGRRFYHFTFIGLAPLVISAIVDVIAPKVVLPGVEFYILAMVLIPFALAQATLKKERALVPALAWGFVLKP